MSNHMDCTTFEASLADFLDGGLDERTYAACEQHRAGCTACHALVADLDAIVTSAQSLPLPAPSHDLWSGIETRLETPVLPLDAARDRRMPAVSPTLVWRRLAVAAVALVTVSAGVTWTLARREPAVAVVAQQSPTDAAPGEATPGDAMATRDASGAATSASLAASTSGPTFAIDTLYGREIAMLRTAADASLGLLDSTTVEVVQRNLDIIDNAIRESREALAADPNSGFLLDQLDRAYERKVDLLRRLVLL
jgi:hypothetical protein